MKVQQHLHVMQLPMLVPTSASRVAALSAYSSTSHVRLLVLSTPAAFRFANSLGMVPSCGDRYPGHSTKYAATTSFESKPERTLEYNTPGIIRSVDSGMKQLLTAGRMQCTAGCSQLENDEQVASAAIKF